MTIKRHLLSGLVAATFCGAFGGGFVPPAAAQRVITVPPADARTLRIVAAAETFLAMLASAQRAAVLFEFTDARQRANWSNLPEGSVRRGGLRRGDLNAEQRRALTDLLATVLSPEGMEMVDHVMTADDVLGEARGRPTFGNAFFFVSFLGEPSTRAPWMLQFGGHHLGINATVVGPNVTLAPSLTGGQPMRFTANGRTVHIAEREVAEAFALLNSLDAVQRRKAVMGSRRIGLVLGAGRDGRQLQPEGLPAGEMTAPQRAQLLALIRTRLGILNADDLAPKMAEIERNLDRTWFAWWGPVAPGSVAYFRVTGPTLLIEYSPEANDGNHAHNIYRDPTNEYGAAWTGLQ